MKPPPSTILVVDDTPANLSVVVEFLEALGHQVVIAQDGEEGIERARFVRPDLILLDVMMPGIDGLETCRRLKAHAETADIPIIFMTALTGSVEKVAGFEAGAVDFVSKPLDVGEVTARITNHLRLHFLQCLLSQQNAALEREVASRRQAQDDLLAVIDGVRNVSNAIAHDLRTPLAALRARLEALLLGPPTRGNILLDIEGAVADLDGVIDIFNALLRLAEIDAGVRRSGFVQVDLRRIAAEAIEFYEPVADQQGSTILLNPGPPCVAFGDPQLLGQALGNLIDNAIKYSDPGSAIGIDVGAAADGMHALSVADRGAGIADADKPRVVERFYRGDKSRSRPGSGLGLALVASVATLHRGRFELSDNHPGLKATLLIPAAVVRLDKD